MRNRSVIVLLISSLGLFSGEETLACFSSRRTCVEDNELFIILMIAEITDKEYFFKIVVKRRLSLHYVEFKECRMLLTCVLETR